MEKFKYEKRYKYPHMMPADVAIWEKFIDEEPSAYEEVEYDVGVGETPEFDTIVNEDSGNTADRLYRKKIDVVAHLGANIDIIELKPSAGASAVGQVKLYKSLYIKEYKPTTEPRAIIITDRVASDVREWARGEGVLFYVVGE
jgi:hypothetical protein